MITIYKTNSVGLAKYSYGSVAAKLSRYVEINQNVRLINSFAYQDPNRDKVNLLFLKQFGVVPQDQVSRYGEIEINELASLDTFDGLTIIIESISRSNTISSSIVAGSNQLENMSGDVRRVNFRQSNKAEAVDMLTEKDINMINQQTQMLARLIETKRQDFRGGYIYISGFSCITSNQGNVKVTEAEFLPWYFELGNVYGMPKIFMQPQLDFFLKNIAEQPPLIANLDDLVDGMVSNESHV